MALIFGGAGASSGSRKTLKAKSNKELRDLRQNYPARESSAVKGTAPGRFVAVSGVNRASAAAVPVADRDHNGVAAARSSTSPGARRIRGDVRERVKNLKADLGSPLRWQRERVDSDCAPKIASITLCWRLARRGRGVLTQREARASMRRQPQQTQQKTQLRLSETRQTRPSRRPKQHHCTSTRTTAPVPRTAVSSASRGPTTSRTSRAA